LGCGLCLAVLFLNLKRVLKLKRTFCAAQLYGDDTMVMGTRAQEMNIVLKQIDIECDKYILKLNRSKCFYIGMNSKENIHFKDSQKIFKWLKLST